MMECDRKRKSDATLEDITPSHTKQAKGDQQQAEQEDVNNLSMVQVMKEEMEKMEKEEIEKEKEHKEKMDQKIKELEKKDQIIRKLKERNQKLKESNRANTVEYLLENFPEMSVNESCAPSIVSNEIARETITKARNDGTREYKFHDVAKIHKFPLPVKLDELNFNTRVGPGLYNEAMSLLQIEHQRTVGSNKLCHNNVSSPRTYLSHAMKDVIECAGVHARVVMEATLFSLRPDLFAVKFQGQLLFAVEVKNPPVTSNEGYVDVFKSETAGGQCFDYLKGLKQQGIDHPFVMLSTFNESVIVMLKGDGPTYTNLLTEGGAGIVERARQRIKNVPETTTNNEKPTVSHSKDDCPDLKCIEDASADSPETDDNEADVSTTPTISSNEEEFDYKGRQVYYSDVIPAKNLYQALSLMLESSLLAAKKSKEPARLIPEDGEDINRDICTLLDNGTTYQKLKCKAQYSKVPIFKGLKFIYAHCVLGQGGHGKCILCSTSSGIMFVAKLFLLPSASSCLGTDIENYHVKMQKEKMEEATEELKRWKLLAQSDSIRKYCTTRLMNNTPALTMPYFLPIPLGERRKAIPQIREKLTDLAMNSNYVYDGQDLHWRHLGRRNKEGCTEIHFLDLGSLIQVKKEDKEKVKVTIEKQMKILEASIGDQNVQPRAVLT